MKGLAERRTDIFGVEETGIGKKVGEEEIPPEEKVAWDGHSSSANLTQKQAKANVSIEEQLQHIQKTQGMLVDHELEKIGPKVAQLSLRIFNVTVTNLTYQCSVKMPFAAWKSYVSQFVPYAADR